MFSVGCLYLALNYYTGVNEAEDPRIISAKSKYAKYNSSVHDLSYAELFQILDTVFIIYNQYDDYKNSYEIGVISNNRGAIWLQIALTETDSIKKDSLLCLAQDAVNKSIEVYTNWTKEFGVLSEDEIKIRMNTIYFSSKYGYERKKAIEYASKRTDDIIVAQKEIARRLSVSYTNLGLIFRLSNQNIEALNNYEKALKLWPNNLSAENNINIILGKPLKEINIIDKLFPENK